MRRLLTHCSVIVVALAATSTVCGAEPVMVSGTYQKGSNITEPRPKKSEFLQTIHGGIAVMGSEAGFYLLTKVIKKPDKALYIRVEYENPIGGPPLQNDMAFEPSAERLLFSAPRFVKGLRNYSDYAITVKIFPSREAQTPIDTLRQTIRSYVDTRGPKAQLYKRLRGSREQRSNHAMERTAGSFDSLHSMNFHPQPAATRSPASRRSSCSR